MEFVPIGNPGNVDDTGGDPDPAGKVDYAFRMGKFEVSEDMIVKANAAAGLGITTSSRGANKPATDVTWFEAATFVNWLNTDQGFTPAYKVSPFTGFQLWAAGDAGFNASNPIRNSQAHFFLPSMDEWYKAAYYNPASGSYFDFPTGSDTAPTAVASGTTAGTAVYNNGPAGPADITQAGGLSPYGTMGQGGNVLEWEETTFDLLNNSISSTRGARGGAWAFIPFGLSASSRGINSPAGQAVDMGFRVASIPEPSAAAYGCVVMLGLLCWRKLRS